MLVQLIVLVICQTVLSSPSKAHYEAKDLGKVQQLFDNFIQKYDKTYAPGEESKRLLYFRENLEDINRLNKENPHAHFDINQFSDLSKDEWKAYQGLKPNLNVAANLCGNLGDPSTKTAPDALDWRTKNIVTRVKNQLVCSSCWAFSATGNVEALYALKHGKQVLLSEQQLVDCDTDDCGCEGGLMDQAFSYLMNAGGQVTEESYPYIAENKTCQFDKSKAVAQLTGCNTYKLTSEDALKELLYTTGPLAIGIDADEIMAYKNGVYTACKFNDLDHGVLLVGYGTEDGVDFWIIKNSWGAKYGEQGYLRIKRGSGCLGILKYTASAVVA